MEINKKLDKEIELIINNWEIIENLLLGEFSPIELSKITKKSLPNITTKLSLLEAYGIIEWEKQEKDKVGKPRKIYRLKKDKEGIILFSVNKYLPYIKKVKDKDVIFLIGALLHEHKNKYELVEFLLNNLHLSKEEGVAIINLDTMLELLVISKHPERILNNINKEKNKMEIKIFAYKFEEIVKGVKENNLHFIGLTKVAIPLWDPLGYIKALKEMIK